MTRLLVSVQNADEAHTATEAGADVIDVKDPRRGSLGAATESTVAAVVKCVAGRVPISVACGELGECQSLSGLCSSGGVQFAKVGLAGCSRRADWPERWAAALEQLSSRTSAVAVVYADWHRVAAPPPLEVLHHAANLGCRVVLVDTCRKSAEHLLDHWPVAQLATFLRAVRSSDLETAVAGSLSAELLEAVLPLQPDYVAVRGAVSRPNRAGPIDGDLVSELVHGLGRTRSRSYIARHNSA